MLQIEHIQLPPCDQAAEKSLLGACLRDNSPLGDIAAVLQVQDFYAWANQQIFRIMLDLYKSGASFDPLVVAKEMQQRAHPGEKGKRLVDEIHPAYLAELWETACAPSLAEDYATIIRDKAILRSVQVMAKDIVARTERPDCSAMALLDDVSKAVFAITQGRDGSQTFAVPTVVQESIDRLELRHKNDKVSGVPSGWPDLDELTGGFQNEELVIIAARPSVGKTSFAINILNHLLDKDIPALFISLEQGRLEIGDRLLCLRGPINSHSMRHGRLHDNDNNAENITRVQKELGNRTTSYICDTPGMNMLRIISECRRLKMKADIKIAIIDYLQLIIPENDRKGSMNRNEQVGAISRQLKLLARELKIPVVALAQLNRQAANDRPKLSDLRESGAIEQDADTVILLWNRRANEPDQMVPRIPINVILGKQRNGPTGEVYLLFEKAFMKFNNTAQEERAAFRNGEE